MRRILAVTAIFTALAVSCGGTGPTVVDTVGGTDTPGAAHSVDPTGEPTGEPSGEPSGEPTGSQAMTFEVWFTYGEKLFMSRRTEPYDPGVGAASMEALMAGPTAAEVAAGVGTAIPSGTTYNGLDIDDGLATVDLSGEYESGGGTLSLTVRVAQVVYTLTQFDSVQEVSFMLDGEPVPVLSGDGIVLDEPVTRDDYLSVFPNILVSSPGIGQRVQVPFDVTGVANSFEATVHLKLLDEDGNELLQEFTTALCGSGCWGDYAFEGVDHPVTEETRVILVIEEDDPSGGENPDGPFAVRIPIVLVP
jgi:hypothetical protein